MDLLELLRKGGMDGDVDFLREALRVLVEGIMDAEVSARTGAEYGERSPERVNQRNGYRSRAWDTRVGTMELHIPKLREGSYFPSLLEPRRRSERALLAVIQQAHQGLRGAIAAVFGGASWQRCRTHFMTNLLTRVPRRVQPWVATMVRTIYQQPSPDEVHAQLDRVTDQLGDRFPQVASLLDEAGPDILAFSSFPVPHWKKIWSNNPLERLNKEIRRRTDVVGIFPNRPAVRRLVGAVLAEQHDEWAVGRRYLTPAILILNEALPEADLAEATAA